MRVRDLVLAAMSGDDLAARQWVKDAQRARVDLAALPPPTGLDRDGMAVAAGLAQLFAERCGRAAPDWTQAVGPASRPIYLCRESPTLRSVCLDRSPEVLRRRNVFAVNSDYLNVL
jgi:hypothetical protein